MSLNFSNNPKIILFLLCVIFSLIPYSSIFAMELDTEDRGWNDVGKMMSYCRNKDDKETMAACYYYYQGVMDSANALNHKTCSPESVSSLGDKIKHALSFHDMYPPPSAGRYYNAAAYYLKIYSCDNKLNR